MRDEKNTNTQVMFTPVSLFDDETKVESREEAVVKVEPVAEVKQVEEVPEVPQVEKVEKVVKIQQADKSDKWAKYPPMMRNYLELKERYSEYIILFQVGDFFEIFFDDAKIVSEVLNIRLTSRDKAQGEAIPLCGVPIHAIDNYLPKLVEEGYSCVVVTQSDDSASKGAIRREISRIVTPGVRYESDGLDEKAYNYLAAAALNERGSGALVYVDVSTGHLRLEEIEVVEELLDNLQRVAPKEIVLPSTMFGAKVRASGWIQNVKELCRQINCKVMIKSFEKSGRKFLMEKLRNYAAQDLLSQPALQSKLFTFSEEVFSTLTALLNYIDDVSFGRPPKISNIQIEDKKNFVFIDAATRRNLELLATSIDGEKRNSLLNHIDYTITSMGARLFRDRLLSPCRDVAEITYRHSITAEFMSNQAALESLRQNLAGIRDLDRLATRITSGRIVPRDLGNLRDSLRILPIILDNLTEFKVPLILEMINCFDSLQDVTQTLESALMEELPSKMNEGGIFKNGFNDSIDELRSINQNSKEYLQQIEDRERNRTGISTLKIRYNGVFGYVIEITKANLSKAQIPEDYERRQTLANAERFVTDELEALERKILSAHGKQVELERQLFAELRETIALQAKRIQTVSSLLGLVDVFQSSANLAIKHNYCRPEIIQDSVLHIKNGRHPVVENVIGEHNFVANDATLDKEKRFAILTGPNMGGKSTYLRQIALIQLLAQAGLFVPASSAKLGLVDRIFTRIGASDDISRGDSTFMVEMREAGVIVKKATKHSLVFIDEIGRGTATADGLALATAIAEWLNDVVQCRTLFATHFHELTALGDANCPGSASCTGGAKEGMFCLTVGIVEQGKEISFTHRIENGTADRSYGIEVARIAGLPEMLLKRAVQVLEHNFTSTDEHRIPADSCISAEMLSASPYGADSSHFEFQEVIDRLQNINPENMKPIEALVELTKLKELAA